MRRWRLALAAVAALAVGAVALDRLFPPDLSKLQQLSSAVTDRHGRLLRAFATADGTWRFALAPEQVDARYRAMLIALEDRRFAVHRGVDPLAMLRAVGQAVVHRRIVSGGSTLTMQVARLLEPRPRTLRAKVIEVLRALQLEARLSKDEILAAYLTLAPFGGNLEGVRAASLAWFGKEPDRLSDAEAALLVALPQSPARRAPDAAPEAARAARDRAIRRALGAGVIDVADAAAALDAPLPAARRPLPFLAPHLAEQVVAGTPPGSVVATTLDLDLQERVEAVLRQALGRLPTPVNVAGIVVDRATGEVRARAGSGDYFAARRNGMVDFAGAVRSPGSTLKPFVYAIAFDGLQAHPASLIRDAPTRYNDYAPENFDGGFDGDVTVRDALRLSLNLPAVTMLERIGPVVFVERMAEAGLPLEQGGGDAPPGLPVVLGGTGATLETLVAGYTALAGDGMVRPPVVMPGRSAASPGRRLVGAAAARQVGAILAEVAPPSGFDGRAARIAYKTGTSYRFRDGWAVGWNGATVIGVWLGRADGATCAICNGPGGAAPLLFRLFDLVAPSPLPPADPADRTPPPALARIERPSTAPEETGLAIAFPPDGATIEAGGRPLLLEASGGTRPFRWLVDGRPLPVAGWRRSQPWSPEGDGFARLTVVDAAGRTATSDVRVSLR